MTRQFIQGVRLGIAFDSNQPTQDDSALMRLVKKLRFMLVMATRGRQFMHWMQVSAGEFSSRFKDPLIRQALGEMWFPEFSMFFMLFTLAYLHSKNAGYPIGGSLPLSLALEKRYLDLGGQVHYRSKVAEILVEADRAVGVRLEDGSEHRAARVISAADGYTTIFKMLEGKYADEKVREPYEKWQIFPPLIFVGLGMNRSFDDVPQTVSGISFD